VELEDTYSHDGCDVRVDAESGGTDGAGARSGKDSSGDNGILLLFDSDSR
jgi:hypothetical protein